MRAPPPNADVAAPTLNHVGIVVPDLTAAIALYRDVLGFAVSEPEVRPCEGIAKAYIQLERCYVELIAPITPDSPIKDLLEEHNASDFLARNPDGALHHICYAVADLAAARARLAAGGVRVLGSASADGDAPICFLDPTATGGAIIELKQGSRPVSADPA